MLAKSRMGGIKASDECVKLLKSGSGESLGLGLYDFFCLCYCYDKTLWPAKWEQSPLKPPHSFNPGDRAEVNSGVKNISFREGK